MRKVYRGKNIEVSFDLDQCVHIGECLRGAPGVFKLNRRPWVLPDEAGADDVAGVVLRCPSGALQFRRLDGGPEEEHVGTTVTPVLNGPLLVVGRIEVTREDRTVEVMPRATLCRCGYSTHKPFCDNEHLKIGFKAPGTPMKIHLSPVRPRVDQPIAKSSDPRGSGVGEHAV
ncbi:MAG TPA: (4Fe-4S)-binding protein [Candidatus Dormibacteraeota bacterium]|nr:(4Fe-4S)-binding protein [Candidatus Dormibacteraeota bacterium]